MMASLRSLLVGYFIGLANIIPGVSGGTFLLIFGIYERVIGAINRISGSLRELLTALAGAIGSPGNRERRQRAAELLRRSDIPFLVMLVAGALIAIVTLSALMKYLLNTHFAYTYAFFFGLILVSIVIPLRLIRVRSPHLALFLVLGVALTVFVSASVNPADKARIKSEHYRVRYEAASAEPESRRVSAEPAGVFSYTGRYTAGEYMVAALAGAIAISAMVLPGISGSLVLILLGQYYEIISAISALRAPTIDIVLLLAAFGIGMAAGLPLFARLVGFVLQRFHDQTMAFLTGLMVGSLYALWPFKRTEVLDLYARVGERITLVRDTLVHTNRNALPGGLTEALLAALFCLAGIGCMAFFVRREIEAGEKASS